MEANPHGPIVVVEDEADLLDLLRDVLEAEGFTVIALSDPKAVDTLTEGSATGLFLLDLMLPGMTGIELARLLRSTGYEKTPMVAMSASPVMLREAAQSSLFQETLAKPFDLMALLDTVDRLVA
jgi:CheY-like chemotaxis protein